MIPILHEYLNSTFLNTKSIEDIWLSPQGSVITYSVAHPHFICEFEYPSGVKKEMIEIPNDDHDLRWLTDNDSQRKFILTTTRGSETRSLLEINDNPLSVKPTGIELLTDAYHFAIGISGELLYFGSELLVQVYDLKTKKLVNEIASPFEKHFDNGIAISTQAGLIAFYGAAKSEIALFDLQNGAIKFQFECKSNKSHLLFTLDGKQLLSGTPDKLQLWNTQTGKLVHESFVHAPIGERYTIFTSAFSSDGSLLLLVTEGSLVTLFETATGKQRWHSKIGESTSAVFSKDEQYVIASNGLRLQLLPVTTGNPEKEGLYYEGLIPRQLSYLPETAQLLADYSYQLQTLDVHNASRLKALTSTRTYYYNPNLPKDSDNFMLNGGGKTKKRNLYKEPSLDKESTDVNQAVTLLSPLTKNYFSHIALSDCYMVSVKHPLVQLYDLEGNEVKVLAQFRNSDPQIKALRFSHNHSFLAALNEKVLIIYSMESLSQTKEFKIKGGYGSQFLIHPDCNRIVVSGGQSFHMINVASGDVEWIYKFKSDYKNGIVDFHLDKENLLIISENGELTVVELANGTLLKKEKLSEKRIGRTALSPERKLFVINEDTSIAHYQL